MADSGEYGRAGPLEAETVLELFSHATCVTQLVDQFALSTKLAEFAFPPWFNDFEGHRAAIDQLAEFAKQVQVSIFPAASWVVDLALKIAPAVPPIASWVVDLGSQFAPALQQIRQIELLTEAGWVAHPALAVGDIVEGHDPGEVRRAVEDYVEQHRDELYDTLDGRFRSYRIDDQKRSFALQLIEAHRHGLFHLIVPAVFPEIERCAREVLGLGAGKGSKIVIAALTERIGNLPISKIGVLHTLSALSLMDEYFYKTIRPEGDSDQFRGMIHRHGSQDGLLRYSSSRDCLNAIFLLDFVLLGCDALGTLAADSKDSEHG